MKKELRYFEITVVNADRSAMFYEWRSKTYGSLEEAYTEMKRAMDVLRGLGFKVIDARLKESSVKRYDRARAIE